MTTLTARATKLVEQIDALGDEASRIFTYFDETELMAEADRLDQLADKADQLPLHGQLVSIKDLFDQAGKRTTAASRLLAKREPALEDSDVVKRLKAAGALIIGRTSMTEFAYSGIGQNPHYGTPGNIFDPTRIPGGSSSGAALSVAHGLCDIAMGTDTGGSVRLPAAVNGLYGFKPSRQAVSLEGVHPLSNTFDSAGPLSRTHALAARCFDVLRLTPVDHTLRIPANRPLRLGIPTGGFTNELDSHIQANFEFITQRLESAGHQLIPVDMAFANENRAAMIGIVSSEAFEIYQDSLIELETMGDPQVLKRIRSSESFSEQDIFDAHAIRLSSEKQFTVALADVDVMLAPTVAIETPTQSEAIRNFDVINPAVLRNTTMVNLMDGCAMTMPVPIVGNASPAALMVVAPNGNDDRVLGVSDQLRLDLNNSN